MNKEKYLNGKIKFCVVEDDPAFRDLFSSLLEEHGDVVQIGHYNGAITYLKRNRPDMLFVDLDLQGKKNGPKIVEVASQNDIHCVVVSSYDDEETINDCINLGARDYYVKGDEVRVVSDIISKYKKTYKKPSDSEFLNTHHPLFKQSLEFLLSNAKSHYPILLSGPTGAGKTFFAKQIHMKSELKGKFVAVNCSSIPKELFESEMFGYEKGAFSGAEKKYEGKILDAHEGTLYLDEIDSMPINQQAKLLKVIEDKEFYPVGSNKIQRSNFRLVCSSQRDLRQMMIEGTFREDLYYRISFIDIRILPLNERKDDIIPLLKNMLKGPRRYQITAEAETLIKEHSWPGNLRELQIFATNLELSKESKITDRLVRKILIPNEESGDFFTEDQKKKIISLGLNGFLELMKKEAIELILRDTRNNVSQTTNKLKISPATYYRWKSEEKNMKDEL
jgi:DNA-binding NtrC family response regulator